jgi:hypothetical protein
MSIINRDMLNERARNLADHGLNGLRLVLVRLVPPDDPSRAELEVTFYNTNDLAAILASITDPFQAAATFPIQGGHRLPAGTAEGQVKVTAVAAGSTPESTVLTVEPIGDYSTYLLGVVHPSIDPLFSEIPFKFRPGCFTNDCAPEWEPAPKPGKDPPINYLAKDYESFRHTMIAAMMERVPGWQSTSEADLDQVLIDLFSAEADRLSDYQDRVMNEAYLATARKRVSLARHARLVDYHIHQGNQASTWLALTVGTPGEFVLPAEFIAWAGLPERGEESAVFASREPVWLHPLFNSLRLYTWDGSISGLAAGSTHADLAADNLTDAELVRDAINAGRVARLLIQEHVNPETGYQAGADPRKRQLLTLLPGEAERFEDPYTGSWYVRVHWQVTDALRYDYCIAGGESGGDISLFHGNLVEAFEGVPVEVAFREPGTAPLSLEPLFYERTERYGTRCTLPHVPLAYLPTPPGGETPPHSTLTVIVETPSGGSDTWDEVSDLVHSDDSPESGDHFVVETDEHQQSIVRFGNGVNGRALPTEAVVRCRYQVGGGTRGNVGRDAIVHYSEDDFGQITSCWNPFDVTNGRDPEPRDKIIRNAPEAYRARQLRAITLADYVRRAEELPGVNRARARYAWTGSWRTVRIAIDPGGTTELSDGLRNQIARHLDAVRLIGEDIEIRPPRFVPLEIQVSLCLHPDFWVEDVRYLLEQEFSDGYTPDGRMGFFHPDRWTFGQVLHRSEIVGRVHLVKGVDHVVSVSMKRFGESTPGPDVMERIEVDVNEIILVKNDPDHMEQGFIRFDPLGGRQ